MITTITRKEATLLMRTFIACVTLRTINWDIDDTSFGFILNFLPWYIVQVEKPPRAPLSRLPSEVRFSFPEVMITGIVGAPGALYCGCIRLGDQSFISAPSHSSPKGVCPLIGFQPILSTTLTEISSGTTCAITIMQCKPHTDDPHILLESEALVLTVPLINFLNTSRSRLFVVKYQRLAVRMRVDIQMDKIDVKPPRVRSNARLSEQDVDLTSPCRWNNSVRSESYEESEVSSHSNSPTAFLSCGSSSIISSEDSSEQESVSSRKSGLLRLRLWDSILPKIQLVRSTPSTEAFSIVVLPPQTPPAR